MMQNFKKKLFIIKLMKQKKLLMFQQNLKINLMLNKKQEVLIMY